jgi:hypothetical protein
MATTDDGDDYGDYGDDYSNDCSNDDDNNTTNDYKTIDNYESTLTLSKRLLPRLVETKVPVGHPLAAPKRLVRDEEHRVVHRVKRVQHFLEPRPRT